MSLSKKLKRGDYIILSSELKFDSNDRVAINYCLKNKLYSGGVYIFNGFKSFNTVSIISDGKDVSIGSGFLDMNFEEFNRIKNLDILLGL